MVPLDKKILKDVSRSFYLSMRVLPKPMREPIILGYLLARASDTLADTENLLPELRLEMLNEMEEILHGADQKYWLQNLKENIIPLQKHQGEIVLLGNIGVVMDWFHSLKSPEIKQAIHTVMERIICGQRLDIERFELQKNFRFTEDYQLEEYCYLVAGCVGEFWTEVGILTIQNFSSEKTEQLKKWGANYGKGLQLINILRDLPNDLKQGRLYLPQGETQDELLAESERWRQQARVYLEEGIKYSQSLTLKKTRFATVLPALIGEETLDLLDNADWEALSLSVKVKRSHIYRHAFRALIF